MVVLADTSQFQKGLESAGATAMQFAGDVKKKFDGLDEGLNKLAKTSKYLSDNLGMLSETMAISMTNDRAAAVFNRVAKAANLSGVEIVRVAKELKIAGLDMQYFASGAAKALGFSTTNDLVKQLKEAQRAYEILKETGVASMRDLALAEQTVKETMAKINAEILGSSVNDAAKTLGFKTESQFVEEYKKLDDALKTVRSSGISTARDIEAAERQWANGISRLEDEYIRFRSVVGSPNKISVSDTFEASAASTLGFKTQAQIEDQLRSLEDAYRFLKESGVASATDIAAAEKLLFAQVQKLVNEYDNLGRTSKNAKTAQQQMLTDAAKNLSFRPRADVSAEIKRLGEDYRYLKNSGTLSAKEIAVAQQQLIDKTRALAREYKNVLPPKNVKESLQQDKSAVDSLARSVMALAGAYVGIGTLKNIASTSIDLASIQKTFFALTGSTEGARAEISYMMQDSQRLGLDFMSLVESYKGFSAAAKTANLDAAQTRNIFSAVSESATVLGLSAEKTKLVLYALEQMLSKGAVSMEELRRQMGDSLPGAFQLGAKAMGLTTQEFGKLVATGRLASAEFLPKFADELRKAFGPGLAEAMKTPRAELQRLMNDFTFAKNEIGLGGFLSGLSGAARELHQTFSSGELHSGLRTLGKMLGEITGVLGNLTAFTLKNSAAFISLVAGFTSAYAISTKLLPAITGLTAAYAAFRTAAFASLTSGVVGFLSGPVGIAAMTAAAGGIAYLSLQQSDAEKTATRYGLTLEELQNQYGELVAGAKNAADATNELTAAQEKAIEKEREAQKEKIEALRQEIADLMNTPVGVKQTGYADPFSGELIHDYTTAHTFLSDSVKSLYNEYLKINEQFNKGLVTEKELSNTVIDIHEKLKQIVAENPFSLAAQDANVFLKPLNIIVNRLSTLFNLTKNITKILPDKWFDAQDETVPFINSTVDDVSVSIKNAYTKSDAGKKEALRSAVEDAEKNLRIAKGYGLSAKEVSMAAANLKHAQDELYKAMKPKGSETSLDRTAYQSTQAFEKAKAAVEQFQIKHAELEAQLSGSGLGVSLQKIAGEYKAQIESIRKEEDKLNEDKRKWSKSGKVDAEGRKNIEDALEQLKEQRLIVEENKKINELIAERAELERQYKAEADYGNLIGNMQLVYKSDVATLQIEKERIDARTKQILLDKEQNKLTEHQFLLSQQTLDYERLLNEEQMRVAEARKNLNIGGMLQTGLNANSRRAQEDYIKFFEELPNLAWTASDAIGTFAAEVGFSTKSMGDAWKDLGTNLQRTIMQMMADLTSLYLKMALFGNMSQSGGGGGALGGIFGAVINGIAGLFSGGNSFTSPGGTNYSYASMSAGYTLPGAYSAHGNVFAAGSELSAYRNMVVTSPTLFAYAQGGVPSQMGLMGEKPGSPGEAILPLTRVGGDLGVKALIGSTVVAVQPIVNIFNEAKNTDVEVQQSQGQGGMPQMDILIREVDGRLAGLAGKGQSQFATYMDTSRGLSSAKTLYR
jgi:tape measure domain-containing protein